MVFLLQLGLLCSGSLSAQLKPKAWILPTTWEKSERPEVQQGHYYDFMWRSFIALNWPNVPIEVKEGKIVSGYRGKPVAREGAIFDQFGKKPLKHFSVWETYREPSTEIFIKPDLWGNYPEWNTPRTLPENGARELPRFFKGMLEYATDLNQPDFFPNPTGPLIDRNGNYVRYEVAVNQAFFTYIKNFKYFNPNEQVRAVFQTILDPEPNPGFERPPHGTKEQFAEGYLKDLPKFAQQGMIDVKAAWRVLDESKGDDLSRYLHRPILTRNEGVKMMGLVALHILRFTPDGQVASTFEQVDNVEGERPSFNDGSLPSLLEATMGFEGEIPASIAKDGIPPKNPKPVSIYRVTPLPDAVKTLNEKYQEDLKGSVFQYYQLIGTQNKHPGKVSFDSDKLHLNGHQGPTSGLYTNTNNLVNAALESYTQKNHSCIQCHIDARPVGVPTQAREVDRFKVLTFLLGVAASNTPSTLSGDEFLGVGESIQSVGGAFTLKLTQSGNLEMVDQKGKRTWETKAGGVGGRFFAELNSVGQFLLYEGSRQNPGRTLWSSEKKGQEGAYYVTVSKDGKLCVMKGTPKDTTGVFWCSP